MLYKWDIIGHQKQLKQLEQEIESGNISHAYLFAGPKGVGKHRIAKKLAGILQCPNNFCQTCVTCKAILKESHPDTIILKDNGESIKIDDVRELIRKTNLTSQSPYRVIVIENIERMPVEAQNSFLKTLEEPPGKTIFLLSTTRINQVLTTILSRVRQYDFFNTEDQILKKYLTASFSDHQNIDEILQIAQGRPGLAINLMKNPAELTDQRTLYNTIENFLKRNDLAQKISFVETLEDEGQLERFFDAFSRYLRKLIFDFLHQKDHPLKSRFTLKEIVLLFESLEKARYLIGRNINKKLALENLFLLTEK